MEVIGSVHVFRYDGAYRGRISINNNLFIKKMIVFIKKITSDDY